MVYQQIMHYSLISLTCWSGKDAVYRAMSRETPYDREYYSSSLASLQIEFVRNKVKDNTQMKNLIRLVKNWRKTHFPVGNGDSSLLIICIIASFILSTCFDLVINVGYICTVTASSVGLQALNCATCGCKTFDYNRLPY